MKRRGYILDIRVGMVAVYPEPMCNCLAGIEADAIYVGRGEMGPDGYWEVSPRLVAEAVYALVTAERRETP